MWIKRSEYNELIIENTQLKVSLDSFQKGNRSTFRDAIAQDLKNAGLKDKIEGLELDIAERDAEIRSLKDKIEGMEVKSLRCQEFYRSESSNNAKKIYSLEEEIKALKKQSTKKPTKETEPKNQENPFILSDDYKVTVQDLFDSGIICMADWVALMSENTTTEFRNQLHARIKID